MRGSIKSVGGVPLMVGLVTAVLLSGCGWFDGPPRLEKLRAGAERSIQPSDSLPALAPPGGYDAAIMPVDASTPALGSIVAASGGQKAQLEKLEKDAAARDAEDRAQRERVAADKANDKAKGDPAVPGSAGGAGRQASTGDRPGEPPTQPAAPARAPVSSSPVPPPPATDTPLDPSTPPKPAGM